jgi:heat shock protein HspQ
MQRPSGRAAALRRALEIVTKVDYIARMMSDVRPVPICVTTRFQIGQVVRHRVYPFRGVIFDVDPVFNNTEEWWNAIPEEVRPRRDQPFYHLYAENETSYYVAYVSEQNLVLDETGEPVDHPEVGSMFGDLHDGRYELHSELRH